MKKRIMAVALAGMMALSLAACGGSSAKSEGTTAAAEAPQQSKMLKALKPRWTEKVRRLTSLPRASSTSSGRRLRRAQCRQEKNMA